MPITSSTTSERLWGTVIVLLMAALFAAGNMMPWGRLWAINHLAFLPPSATWVFASIIAMSLIAIWTAGDTGPPTRSSQAYSLLQWLPVIVLVWIAAAYLFRAETPLLGDGYLRIDEAERRPPGLLLLTDLLPGLITTSFQQNLGAGYGLTGRDTIAWFSILSGAIFVIGALLLWTRAVSVEDTPDSETQSSPLNSIWLLTSGAVMMFVGYFETYGLAAAALSLFALAALAHGNRRVNWLWPLGLWLVAFWSHLLAVGWVPALLWALMRGSSNRKQTVLRVSTGLAAVIGSIIGIALLRESGTPFLWHRYLLPVFSAEYSLFDWRHAADLLNHVLLVLPVLLCLALPERESASVKWPALSLVLAGPSMAFCLLFAADLGWARDWDLYALASMPGIVVASIYFARVQVRWSRPRRIAAITVALSALCLWVWVNANESTSVQRFQYLLQLDNHIGTSGHETMARYWRDTQRWDLAVDELGRALEKEPHARLAIQRGVGLGILGHQDSSLAMFRLAIESNPSIPEGHFGAGLALVILGHSDSAQAFLEHAVRMDSNRTDFRYNLGICLINQGNFAEALPHLGWAAAQSPDQPMIVNSWANALAEVGQLDFAANVLMSLIKQTPDFELAYANLAMVRLRQADTVAAENALREYERRVPEPERMNAALRIRVTLDSASMLQ